MNKKSGGGGKRKDKLENMKKEMEIVSMAWGSPGRPWGDPVRA